MLLIAIMVWAMVFILMPLIGAETLFTYLSIICAGWFLVGLLMVRKLGREHDTKFI